jgi:hypothetical protein
VLGTYDAGGYAYITSDKIGTGSYQPLAFFTSGSERLRITSTGALNFVGAGTAGSTQAVSFNGSAPVNSLVIDSSGRVGLGTSSPGTGTSSYYDDLVIKNDGSGTGAGITIQSNSTNGFSGLDLRKADGTELAKISASASTSKLAIDAAGTTAITIDSSQRVGIGTTGPLTIFDVKPSTNRHIVFSASSTYANNAVVGVDDAGYESALGIGGNPIQFFTGSSERARIDSSGRLLVGTSSDRSSAGVNGRFQLEGTSYNTSSVNLINNGNDNQPSYLVFGKSRSGSVGGNTVVQSGDYLGRIDFAGADGSNLSSLGAFIGCQVDGTPGAGDMPGRLVFSTTADGASSPTARMTIKNGGEVCIGTTDAHVANRNALENATTGQLTFRHSSTTAGRYNIVGMNSGSAFIVSDSSGGTGVQLAYSGTSWSTLSDERFKTDLEPIESGLSKVATLRALTGRLVTDPEDKRRSFLIAQDVDAVLPEAVDKTDPEALALSYTEVVPLLVAALKESKERIEQLEAKVAALESA